jgi:hypothetical protein
MVFWFYILASELEDQDVSNQYRIQEENVR